MREKIILALGSNLGNSVEFLQKAIELLESSNVIDVLKISSLYKTEPLGGETDKWFTNIAISGFTKMSIFEVLHFCKSIEYLLGRKIRKKWGDREIDIDILFYGKLVFSSKHLEIPHPQMHLRNFVLLPLMEIEPEFIHPTLNRTINEIFSSSKDSLKVIKQI